MNHQWGMHCLGIALALMFLHVAVIAQNNIDCEKAANLLPDIQKKINKISTTNPELISLHYLLIQDIADDIKKFQTNYLPQLHNCPEIDFYQQKHYCDTLLHKATLLKDTLEVQRKRVDTIFYLFAVDELCLFDTNTANYYLDRAIQYNPLLTDALILKLKLLFIDNEYDKCIELIHVLYNDAPLKREHENQLSDFTDHFYDELFQLGDSLIHIGHAADALPVFETLENFCHDMPSAYCNDDYYRGIIRSKTGVYESYLTIAKVAYEKKNYEIAYKFLDYADSYLTENKDNIIESEEYLRFKEMLLECREKMNQIDNYVPDEEPQKTAISPTIPKDDVTTDSAAFPTDAIPETSTSNTAKELEYNRLFIDALYYSLNEEYDKAFEILQKATELEKCNCFYPDPRVRLLYDEYLKNKQR
ncbi:MAG TPA: hypothetical protein PK740_03510 [Bacteroidales bacterium]|jgi:hypothetical protein|nr:hypothetical protein [Bacteroidales bacterium]HPT52331.1 hypothetical protein [Bacteroidales bacterium]